MRVGQLWSRLILQLTAGRAECRVTGAGCCRDWEPFCYVKLGFVIPVRAETRFPFNTYEGLHVTKLNLYISIRLDTCLVNNTPRVQPQNSVVNYICVYSKHGRSHTDQWNNLHAGALGGAWATRLQILATLTLAFQCVTASYSTNTDNR